MYHKEHCIKNCSTHTFIHLLILFYSNILFRGVSYFKYHHHKHRQMKFNTSVSQIRTTTAKTTGLANYCHLFCTCRIIVQWKDSFPIDICDVIKAGVVCRKGHGTNVGWQEYLPFHGSVARTSVPLSIYHINGRNSIFEYWGWANFLYTDILRYGEKKSIFGRLWKRSIFLCLVPAFLSLANQAEKTARMSQS